MVLSIHILYGVREYHLVLRLIDCDQLSIMINNWNDFIEEMYAV